MSDTPRTDALIRFEFGPTGHPFPAHALLAMMQLARELERELAKARELCDKFKWQVRDTCQRAEKAEAECERLRPDAERYRWLQSEAKQVYMHPNAEIDNRMRWEFPVLIALTCINSEVSLNAAIDAARRK